jgi:hypothetical protein
MILNPVQVVHGTWQLFDKKNGYTHLLQKTSFWHPIRGVVEKRQATHVIFKYNSDYRWKLLRSRIEAAEVKLNSQGLPKELLLA